MPNALSRELNCVKNRPFLIVTGTYPEVNDGTDNLFDHSHGHNGNELDIIADYKLTNRSLPATKRCYQLLVDHSPLAVSIPLPTIS